MLCKSSNLPLITELTPLGIANSFSVCSELGVLVIPEATLFRVPGSMNSVNKISAGKGLVLVLIASITSSLGAVRLIICTINLFSLFALSSYPPAKMCSDSASRNPS